MEITAYAGANRTGYSWAQMRADDIPDIFISSQIIDGDLAKERLVDLMGGSIKVTSKLGEGSTFTVELELRIQEQEDDPKFWTDSGLKRMLVADDEEAVCQNVVRLMSQTGVEVDCATGGERAFDMLCYALEAEHPYDVVLLDWKIPHLNGLETARLIRERYPEKIPILLLTVYDWSEIAQEAVDRFEASQPGDYDLILMDVQMPVMDGYTATRTIRASAHPSAEAIPIIAMTANAFVDDVRDVIESGMDAHIAKPVQIDNLKSTIRQVLESRLKQSEEAEPDHILQPH